VEELINVTLFKGILGENLTNTQNEINMNHNIELFINCSDIIVLFELNLRYDFKEHIS